MDIAEGRQPLGANGVLTAGPNNPDQSSDSSYSLGTAPRRATIGSSVRRNASVTSRSSLKSRSHESKSQPTSAVASVVGMTPGAGSSGEGGAAQGALTAAVGTPMWMAPEALAGKQYGYSADVYSFGLCWSYNFHAIHVYCRTLIIVNNVTKF